MSSSTNNYDHDGCEIIYESAAGERWRGIAEQRLRDTVGVEGLTIGLDQVMKKGAVLKDGSKSFVSHVQLGSIEVVIKGYRHLGWIHSLRHSIKGSRAHTAWLLANRLTHLGVPTPTPLAFIDVYRGFVLWRSYFIYEYIVGPTLNEILKDPGIARERKRRLIDHVLALLRHLSENGISHGDLKHTNMICRSDQVELIDLDALRRIRGPAFLKRWRFRKDKARFLRDIHLQLA